MLVSPQNRLAWSAVTCIRKRSNWGLICVPCGASRGRRTDPGSVLTTKSGGPLARTFVRWMTSLFVILSGFLNAFLGDAFANEPPSPPVYDVRMEQTWIPMKDGVRLAATLYTPDAAKPGEKFPALLEYLPYRKDDGTAAGDYPKHAYFARRGYVSVRVDIRGFGASEGAPPEREDTEQEQLVGQQNIAWLAHQPWSNG